MDTVKQNRKHLLGLVLAALIIAASIIVPSSESLPHEGCMAIGVLLGRYAVRPALWVDQTRHVPEEFMNESDILIRANKFKQELTQEAIDNLRDFTGR